MKSEAKHREDRIVCACLGVTERQIRETLGDPSRSYDGLVEETGIGTRCTACLLDLDLIVDDAVQFRSTVSRRLGAGPAREGGLQASVDQSNSGFFLCRDDVTTVLRVANFGLMFGDDIVGVPYDYSLRLIREDGRHLARRTGSLGRGETLHLDFAEILGRATRGWFLLSLYPREHGLMGSVRPQVSLCGDGWMATYHTQLHSMATVGRTRARVAVLKAGGAFDASVSVINAREQPCRATFRLADLYGDARFEAEVELPGRGSGIFELDRLFAGAPADGTYRLDVVSDRATRKHILIRHPDGSMSVDHFPN